MEFLQFAAYGFPFELAGNDSLGTTNCAAVLEVRPICLAEIVEDLRVHLLIRAVRREKGVHTLVSIIVVSDDRAERRSVIGMSGDFVVHGAVEVARSGGAFGGPV